MLLCKASLGFWEVFPSLIEEKIPLFSLNGKKCDNFSSLQCWGAVKDYIGFTNLLSHFEPGEGHWECNADGFSMKQCWSVVCQTICLWDCFVTCTLHMKERTVNNDWRGEDRCKTLECPWSPSRECCSVLRNHREPSFVCCSMP